MPLRWEPVEKRVAQERQQQELEVKVQEQIQLELELKVQERMQLELELKVQEQIQLELEVKVQEQIGALEHPGKEPDAAGEKSGTPP